MSYTGFRLEVDYCRAGISGDTRHAVSIVRGLGIDYEWSEGEPKGEQVVFHGCTNVPSRLPTYVRQIS